MRSGGLPNANAVFHHVELDHRSSASVSTSGARDCTSFIMGVVGTYGKDGTPEQVDHENLLSLLRVLRGRLCECGVGPAISSSTFLKIYQRMSREGFSSVREAGKSCNQVTIFKQTRHVFIMTIGPQSRALGSIKRRQKLTSFIMNADSARR